VVELRDEVVLLEDPPDAEDDWDVGDVDEECDVEDECDVGEDDEVEDRDEEWEVGEEDERLDLEVTEPEFNDRNEEVEDDEVLCVELVLLVLELDWEDPLLVPVGLILEEPKLADEDVEVVVVVRRLDGIRCEEDLTCRRLDRCDLVEEVFIHEHV
jgi:hypothetical protein